MQNGLGQLFSEYKPLLRHLIFIIFHHYLPSEYHLRIMFDHWQNIHAHNTYKQFDVYMTQRMARYCAHDPLDTPYHDQFSDFTSWLQLWESEFHGPAMVTEWSVEKFYTQYIHWLIMLGMLRVAMPPQRMGSHIEMVGSYVTVFALPRKVVWCPRLQQPFP